MDINRIRSNIKQYYKQKKEEHYREYSKKKNEQWYKYYQYPGWKKLRDYYYTIYPCCQVCEKQGIITSTDEIHHIKPFSTGITDEAKYNLLLNSNNLIALCKHHHLLAHKYMREKQTDKADIDDIIAFEEEINKKISQ